MDKHMYVSLDVLMVHMAHSLFASATSMTECSLSLLWMLPPAQWSALVVCCAEVCSVVAEATGGHE